LAAVAWVLLAVQASQAGFEYDAGTGTYVESFAGTTKDPATWEEYSVDGFVSREDEGLVYLGGNKADYTTKAFTVGVGEYARVYLDESSSGTYGTNALLLTTNSLGTSGRATDDSRVLSVQWNNYTAKIFARVSFDAGAVETDMDIATGFGGLDGIWFQIERLSSTEARFSAFDSGLDVIGTVQTMTFSDVPDDLYIGLYTASSYCHYDNVVVGSVPEPVTMGLLAMGGLGMVIRRRR